MWVFFSLKSIGVVVLSVLYALDESVFKMKYWIYWYVYVFRILEKGYMQQRI